MSTFKYQHITKAPPIDVFDAPAPSGAGLGDSTVDAHNNNAEHVYQNVGNGNSTVAPTQALCDSIAHKNNFMKRQLTFLLEHLSEAYE